MINLEYPQSVRIERNAKEWVITFNYGARHSMLREVDTRPVKATLLDLKDKGYWFTRGRAFVEAFRESVERAL